jgi:hypothetical protein
MNKQKKILIGIIIFIIFLIVDRYVWMPNRAKNLWIQESGRNLGDPIAYNQDFVIQGSEIIFQGLKSTNEYPSIMENRKSNFYFAGCYFGNLYIYDLKRKEITIYFDK